MGNDHGCWFSIPRIFCFEISEKFGDDWEKKSLGGKRLEKDNSKYYSNHTNSFESRNLLLPFLFKEKYQLKNYVIIILLCPVSSWNILWHSIIILLKGTLMFRSMTHGFISAWLKISAKEFNFTYNPGEPTCRHNSPRSGLWYPICVISRLRLC